MVLTLDFGLSLANADPLQPISRIIPAANIANFFTLLSLTRPKSSVLKDCTRREVGGSIQRRMYRERRDNHFGPNYARRAGE